MTGPEYAARRKQLDLTQAELARLLGLGKRTVESIEASETVTRRDELALAGLESELSQAGKGEA